MKAENLIGQHFGHLTIVGRAPNSRDGKTMWYCQCDCGQPKEKPVRLSDLKSGKVRSCGCVHCESAQRNGHLNKKHGMTGTRLWRIWQGMKQRCSNRRNYKHVRVCNDWLDFRSFYKWSMEHGYSDNLTLDRIDPNGNYEPTNCRWASWKVQENNRRNNRIVTYRGMQYTLSQLASTLNISPATLSNRLLSGWPEDDLWMAPNLNNKNIRSGKYA